MAKRRIEEKILAINALAVLIALALVSVAYYLHFTKNFVPELEAKAAAVGKTVKIPIERSLEVGLSKDSLFGVNERLTDAVIAYPDIKSMYVIDIGGEIIFHSDRERIGKKIDIRELSTRKATLDGEAHSTIIRENGERYHFIYLPITGNGELAGWIGINLGEGPIKDALVSFLRSTLFSVGAALIVSWAITRQTAKKVFLDPLFILRSTARQLSRGNFTTRAIVSTNDEIGELAETFNFMAEEIKISHKKLNDNLDTLKNLLETKTEFLQIVNHQLRTPVSIMNGYLEFFRRGTYESFPADKKSDIQKKILIAFDQLNEIIEMMIEAFEIEGSHPEVAREEFDLSREIGEIANEFDTAAARKGIKIEKIFPEGIHIINDRRHIKTIVSNLMDNAVKYTPPNGKITMELKTRNGTIIMKVADTGIGLSRDDLAVIFHKFARTAAGKEQAPSGTGLGLYIARKIAKEIGGEVTAESKGRNMGSVFSLELPIKIIG